jgi:UDP-glucose 4-epimerase
MRVAVTGGAGFIGANLVKALVEQGDDVAVIDDLSTGSRANLNGVENDVAVVEGTILDPTALDKVIDGTDAVVHLAARGSVPRSIDDPVASNDANVNGTIQVLEAVRRAGNPHVIVASSSSVYGANPTLPKHEGLLTQPVSPYAVSKLATETYTLSYQLCFDVPALAFRFFNVFGPLQPAGHAYAAVIPAFLDAATDNRPLPVHGDGHQTRDFTYVGSVAGVIIDAIRRRVTSPTPLNLAFGGRISLLEVIAAIETELGHPLERDHQPPRAGDVRDSQADQSALRALFPDVTPVPFEDGRRATIDWFRASVSAGGHYSG